MSKKGATLVEYVIALAILVLTAFVAFAAIQNAAEYRSGESIKVVEPMDPFE